MSEADIGLFFGGGGGSAAPAPAPAPALAAAASPGGSTDDARFAQFNRMRKCRVPDGAIRLKMQEQGMSEADIGLFFGSGGGGAAAAAAPARAATAPVLPPSNGGAGNPRAGLLSAINAGSFTLRKMEPSAEASTPKPPAPSGPMSMLEEVRLQLGYVPPLFVTLRPSVCCF